MGRQLGQHQPVLPVSAGEPEGDLHHQCDREFEHEPAQIDPQRRIFPNAEAAIKALYLAVEQASRNWKQIHHWKPALRVFQILFGEDRVPVSAMQ